MPRVSDPPGSPAQHTHERHHPRHQQSAVNPSRRPRPLRPLPGHQVRIAVPQQQHALKEAQGGQPNRGRSAQHRKQRLGRHRLHQKQQGRAQKHRQPIRPVASPQPAHSQAIRLPPRAAGPAEPAEPYPGATRQAKSTAHGRANVIPIDVETETEIPFPVARALPRPLTSSNPIHTAPYEWRANCYTKRWQASSHHLTPLP